MNNSDPSPFIERAAEIIAGGGVVAASPFIERAAEIIAGGGVVAVPTETFYGLAADPGQPAAVARIFEIKGRPATLALPLVAASLEQVVALCGPLDEVTMRAAKAFWPGPLSLVVEVPGNRTIAVRVPSHDFVRALAERAGIMLTSTSANKTGEPPAETADAVKASLGGLVDLIVDGGSTPGGKPSTIADLRGVNGAPPLLLRDGAIAWSRVLESLQ